MTLPLVPPIKPQLARTAKALPEGDEWRYEPKYDGFRMLAYRDGDEVYLQSRGGKPMNRYFPDVEAQLLAMPEDRVVLAGVRDLDPKEREALERSDVSVIGASPVETLVAVKNALNGEPVYIHLDLDVLDPAIFPAREPAPGGLAPEKLFDLLEAVVADSELVGLEVTTFEAPEDEEDRQEACAIVMRVLEPLLEAIPESALKG